MRFIRLLCVCVFVCRQRCVVAGMRRGQWVASRASEQRKCEKAFAVVCLINMLITMLTPKITISPSRAPDKRQRPAMPHSFGHSHSIQVALRSINERPERQKNQTQFSVVSIFLSMARCCCCCFCVFSLLFESCRRSTKWDGHVGDSRRRGRNRSKKKAKQNGSHDDD